MTMVSSAQSFLCPNCRDLTDNLLKSVYAFEVFAAGNPNISADLLISTIREIIANAGTNLEMDQVHGYKGLDSPSQCSENVDIDVKSTPTRTTNTMDMDLDTFGSQQENMIPAKLRSRKLQKKKGRPKGLKSSINNTNINFKKRQIIMTTVPTLMSMPTTFSSSSSASANFSLIKRPIPPNLSVKNPWANLNLEKAMQLKVLDEKAPNRARKSKRTTAVCCHKIAYKSRKNLINRACGHDRDINNNNNENMEEDWNSNSNANLENQLTSPFFVPPDDAIDMVEIDVDMQF